MDAITPDGEWACASAALNTHAILRCTKANVVTYYLRLPDGNGEGQGFGFGSLALLRTGGVASLKRYPAALNPETLFEPAEREAVGKALEWARAEKARYALTGAVQEWRYKVGVDGEPAVGISLQLLDVNSGEVVWSATGSDTPSTRATSRIAARALSVPNVMICATCPYLRRT